MLESRSHTPPAASCPRNWLTQLYAHTPVTETSRGDGGGVGKANASAVSAWLSQACLFEEARHNCFIYAQPSAQRIAEFFSERACGSASAQSVVSTLAGRTLFLFGDSLVRQLVEAVMCRLRGSLIQDGSEWKIPHNRGEASCFHTVCPLKKGSARHCRLYDSCSTFAVGNQSAQVATICYRQVIRPGWLQLAKYWKTYSPLVRCNRSVVVFNSGAAIYRNVEHSHAWGGDNYTATLHARDAFLAELSESNASTLLLPYPQQHFDHPDGTGEFASTARLADKRTCVPLNSSGSWRHAQEAAYVAPFAGAVLGVRQDGEAAWWAHTEGAPNAGGASADCTHYCMPGLPDLWASKLFNYVVYGVQDVVRTA